MLLGPGINAAKQKATNPKLNTRGKVMTIAAANNESISSVEFKNIGSAGFIQLIFVRIVIKS